MDTNLLILEGLVSGQVEHRTTQSGKSLVEFTVESKGYRDKVTPVRCICFDDPYVSPGDRVTVKGKVSSRPNDVKGKVYWNSTVWASQVVTQGKHMPPKTEAPSFVEDDLPF